MPWKIRLTALLLASITLTSCGTIGIRADNAAAQRVITHICPKVQPITPEQQKALAGLVAACTSPAQPLTPWEGQLCHAFLFVVVNYGKNREEDRICLQK